jgi:predicted RNA-binding protein with PUA-like domain
MKQYWLGVIAKLSIVDDFENNLWWCLPSRASQGDIIVMYCPRALSRVKQGVFAECKLKTKPDLNNEQSFRCSGFGRTSGKGMLSYTELNFLRRFDNPLTAKEMKRDPLLKDLGCVRRSFQGTTFPISEEAYKRIVSLTEPK